MKTINTTPYIISVNIPNNGYSFLVHSSTDNDKTIIAMAKEKGLFEEEEDAYYAEVLVADEHDLLIFDADDAPMLVEWNTMFDATSTADLFEMASKAFLSVVADVCADYDTASEDTIRHFLYSVAKRGNTNRF